jgi:hypothetical protein
MERKTDGDYENYVIRKGIPFRISCLVIFLPGRSGMEKGLCCSYVENLTAKTPLSGIKRIHQGKQFGRRPGVI